MLGIRETAQLLADRAMDHLPGEVARLAGELGAAVAVPLPPSEEGPEQVITLDAIPRMYAATQLRPEYIGAEDWPFVMVVPRAMTALKTMDEAPDGRQLKRATWTTRWWLYARGDGYHITAAVRDRLTLAMMEMLLRDPAWSGELYGVPYGVEVQVENMTAQPSDLDDALASIIGGCWIEAPVHITSWLAPLHAPSPVTAVTHTVTRLEDVHPALL